MLIYLTDHVRMPAIRKQNTTSWIKAVAKSYGKTIGEIAYIF
ncbi:Endoribonuclease YbeY, partial [termite gut metagenome]